MFIMTLQKQAPIGKKPFYVVLVTARNAMDPATRVMHTFKSWESSVDETHFLNGKKKARIVHIARPHIFLDDQDVHVEPASKLVPAARVPWMDEAIEKEVATAGTETVKAVA
jgi:5'-nucleotidase